MTALDIAQVLKDATVAINEEISRLTRRRAVYQAAATRLRLGVSPEVVKVEIQAAGEPVPEGVEEEMP